MSKYLSPGPVKARKANPLTAAAANAILLFLIVFIPLELFKRMSQFLVDHFGRNHLFRYVNIRNQPFSRRKDLCLVKPIALPDAPFDCVPVDCLLEMACRNRNQHLVDGVHRIRMRKVNNPEGV